MKAITIWQPWASLLAIGEKQFETRSWATTYRGPIAIHSASMNVSRVLKKCFPCGAWDYHPDHQAMEAFKKSLAIAFEDYAKIEDIIGYLEELPLGSVVATANLIGCHKIVRHGGRGLPAHGHGWLETERGIFEPDEQELMFGNWEPDRYAWEFSDMKQISPVPAKGKQGMWEWKGETA